MGKLLVFVGPSCSGKTSIRKKIISMFPIKFKPLITCTTREKRHGEIYGVDYYFLSPDEFNWKIYQEKFIEYTEYAGNKYGVLRETIDTIKTNHSFTVAVMDLNGIKKMIEYLGKENIVTFYIDITPETMLERLKNRGENKQDIQARLEKAKNEEMKKEYKDNFDFIINNDGRNIDIVVFEIVNKVTQK
jgi:guanylate kinase